MSEPEYLMNQKKINGRLCQVDWNLISALREVVAALRASGTSGEHIQKADHLIELADKISKTVAIPDPPGCSPRDRTAAPDAS